jgi:hypothetical protein
MPPHDSDTYDDVQPGEDVGQFITSRLSDPSVSSIELYRQGDEIWARIHYS